MMSDSEMVMSSVVSPFYRHVPLKERPAVSAGKNLRVEILSKQIAVTVNSWFVTIWRPLKNHHK